MNQTSAHKRNLYILDVGHGNCSVIRSGDDVIVIDVGRSSTLLEFLLEQELKTINTIFISHADVDHMGALSGLLATECITIQNVVINSDSVKETKAWRRLAYELNEANKSGKTMPAVGLISGNVLEIDNMSM